MTVAPFAIGIGPVSVTEPEDGQGGRDIVLSWTVGGAPQVLCFRGLCARMVHSDLAACRAIGEGVDIGYVTGIARFATLAGGETALRAFGGV